MEKLTIGEMSKLNNVSQQTLRLYDRINILKPNYINEKNGYRYYSITQSARLDMIQHMKSLGMTLNEIKEQLDKNDISIIQHILEKKRDSIDNKIKELKLTKKSVDIAIENFERYNSAPKEGIILLEFIKKRIIYRYKGKKNIYGSGLESYEYMLRELKSHIKLNKLPLVYFCNVGSIIRKRNLFKNDFISNEIFLFIDDDFEKSKYIEEIPANMYLCIYCDSFHKEIDYAKKLIVEANEKGYKIIGDYICEVVVELPILNNRERNMFIKLQIPVEI